MATFYIQLENKLLQISGELTAENISKALGYVPVDSSTMDNYATKDEVSDLVDMSMVEELSQRVDNITFDSLKDNPFLQDGSGELNIVDESGNIITKIDAEGIHSVDFIAGEHRLSDKTDKTYVDEAIKNVEVDLTGYATEEWIENKNYLTEHQDISHLATKDEVTNIDFYNIKDNPIVNNGDGKLLFVDENGYIGLQLEEDGLYVKDVIADGHTLSQKANKSDLPTKLSDLDNDTNYITLADIPPVNIPSLDEYVTEEELNSKGYITQHQDISHLATKAEVSDIDFYNIKNNPVINSETGKLLFVDESGNIGLQLENDGLYVSNVFAGPHVLSNKADKSEVPTSTSQLTNDSGYITKPVVDQAIASLVDSAPETLDTIGEIASALKNNANIVDVLNQSISSKQNTIEDLEAIRAGAAKGATALQEIPEEYAKKEDIPSLNGYATQAWVNNKNYATEEDLSSIEFNSLQNNPLVEDSNGEFNLVDDLGNVGFKVNQEGLFVKDVIAGNHVLSNKANISDIPESITESTVSDWGFTKNAGTYSKPSGGIPNSDLSSDVRNALRYAEMYQGTVTSVKINGETKGSNGGVVDLGNLGTYSKPSTGIPKSDLASDVQASLSNAVQKDMVGTLNIIEVGGVYDGDYVYALPTAAAKNADEDYDDIILSRGSVKTINGESIVGSGNIEISGGTITGVSANGTSIATSGVANIPAASTSAYGVTKLSSATNSTSTTLAATASAVKAVYDLANSYKGTVTGVKINGSTKSPSSGTVDIGSIATSVKINGVSKSPSSGVVDLGYINKQLSTSTSSSMVIRPNMYYRNISTSLTSLMITLYKEDVNGILNEYFVEFTTRSSGTSVSLPSGIKWMNGVTPTFEAGTTYQISIVNKLGTWVKFK